MEAHSIYVDESFCVYCGVDLEDSDVCPDCAETHKYDRLRAMGLKERWWDVTWDDFVNPGNERSVAMVREWAESWPPERGRGLIISSRTPGTGKSLLAACALKTVGKGLWVNCTEMLKEIKDSWNDGPASLLEKQSYNAPLLVLDDFGAHRMSQWTEDLFYLMVHHRDERLLPIIVTTNLENRQQLEECYGERTVDRIIGMCDVLRLKGESFRRKRSRRG